MLRSAAMTAHFARPWEWIARPSSLLMPSVGRLPGMSATGQFIAAQASRPRSTFASAASVLPTRSAPMSRQLTCKPASWHRSRSFCQGSGVASRFDSIGSMAPIPAPTMASRRASGCREPSVMMPWNGKSMTDSFMGVSL